MPRPSTSCRAVRPEEEWCSTCRKPQQKLKCLLAHDRSSGPAVRGCQTAPSGSSSRTSAPAATKSSWISVDSADTFEDDGQMKEQVDEDTPADGRSSPEVVGVSSRERKQPERYEPADFFRRELPLLAADKGSQLARKREIEREKQEELERVRRTAYEDGLARADKIVKDLEGRFDSMWKDLVAAKEKLKKERAEAMAYRRKVDRDKRQKTLQHFFGGINQLPHEARPRSEPTHLGEGYTQRNILSGCFAQHVKAVETQIIMLAKDDPLKQLQLAAAVSQRMQGIRHLRDRDQEAWSYVRNSLKSFFETLQDKYHGRYPNHVRAAQQAVCAAIASAAPPRKLHVIHEAIGAPVERLSEGRRHWTEWICGDRKSIMDLRGKARADGMEDDWIDFTVDIWKDSTRRSERAKDSVRNPHDKADENLYRIHWLEVRIADIHELIVREGKRKFDRTAVEAVPATDFSPAVEAVAAVEFHFSWWYVKKVRPFFVKDGGREVCVCVYHLRSI